MRCGFDLTARFFRRIPESEKNKKIDPKLEAICHDLEEKMKGILGTKVAINQKDNKKGKIEIEYYSMDELERLMEILMK